MLVPHNIMHHLGGIRFALVTGANTFVGSDKGLICSLPNAPKNHANSMRVLVQDENHYIVEFAEINNNQVNHISRHENVSRTHLKKVFTEQTGLIVY